MNYWFFLKCFLVGVSVASAVGPIFVLTFNRAAHHGFLKGFFTALGSAFGDTLLFLLGGIGLLSLIEGSKKIILCMDLVGGCALILSGIRMLEGKGTYKQPHEQSGLSIFGIMSESFFLTIINPLALVFFMFISVQLLPEGVSRLTFVQIIGGSLMIAIGSLSIFTIVSLVASRLGKSMNPKSLHLIEQITGIILMGIGFYFLGDFVLALFTR